MTKQNIKLWEQFKKITKNKKYFEFADIDKLKLNWNILFFLGKKNIGKSYQLNLLIKSLKDNERFIYGRFSASEIETTRTTWNDDAEWPYYIDSKRIIRHKHEFTYTTHTNKKGESITKQANKIVGTCVIFQTLQNTASAFNGFENFKFILFDEIIPLNPQEMKPNHIESFIRFISNVERNKTDLKIYMLGNNNGPNVLMSQLKISTADNLIWREEEKFLFINSQDIYKGIENQQTTLGLLKYSIAFQDAILNNKPLSISQRQITDLNIINEFNYWISIIHNYSAYHIKKINTNHQGYKITMYLLHRELYVNDETIKHLIKHKNIRLITFDELTANNFDYVKYIDNENAETIKQTIYTIVKAKRLFFENQNYVSELIKIINNTK
ncbi:hypothetical protein [Mycoplasmopsis bovis]|uniref:hypothetical protein n=1 Tax=Mycoplasmopsis bovis TaxID=28903 RepID=UPI00094B03BD|nr:hypothetical protein [Mycoplasmopsis bovis]